MRRSETGQGAAQVPRRPYGKGGDHLSVIGFGGIVVRNAEPSHARRVVAEAVERGVNYFDVAPTYGDAEEKLGPALEPFRRSVFLACKTTQRRRGPAEEEFRRSLQRLRTDHFDLYQLHGLTDVEKDVDAAFAADGVMEMGVAEMKAGRIRHLGFSAHTEEAALAAMGRYDFDSVLFPINFCAWLAGGFGERVVAEATRRGMSVLALKALARQQWPADDGGLRQAPCSSRRGNCQATATVAPQRRAYGKCWYQPVTDRAEAELALRFTLSQPITAAVSPGEEALLRLALDVAPGLRPITAAETEQLRTLAASLRPIFTTGG